MRRIQLCFALLGAALLTSPSFAAGTVVGSRHDLREVGGGTPTGGGLVEVCVSCHTPHQPTGITIDPLWNHTMSVVASYGVYASTTLNAVPADIGGGTTVSNLCMSCHDGTVSVLSMYNNPPAGAPVVIPLAGRILASGLMDPANTANLGTDLSNDHPVNFTYDAALAAADGGLNVPPIAGIPLFGGTLQCASCHNPHDPTNQPFLRVSNVASAMCLACHIK